MSWLLPPHPNERWRELARPHKIRTVRDRAPNGDIIYILGRVNSYAATIRCSKREWDEWVKNAEMLAK